MNILSKIRTFYVSILKSLSLPTFTNTNYDHSKKDHQEFYAKPENNILSGLTVALALVLLIMKRASQL